jgi:hypothetical protein
MLYKQVLRNHEIPNADQKTKGYYEQSNKKAKLLLAMPQTAEKEYNARKSIAFNPHDTHLYEVKSNLPMNYAYKGVPEALATKVIGYAPESTFVNNGWLVPLNSLCLLLAAYVRFVR